MVYRNDDRYYLHASSVILAKSTISSAGVHEKVRVKMQVIKAGTVWRNADIPIIDHPSAFFVCNQDPRVAEQFHMMAVEMKYVRIY